VRRGLFLKYVVLFVSLVTGVLVINAAVDLYFAYQDNRRASIEVQQEKADRAAQRIESFVREIERQFGWMKKSEWAALPVEQRRLDYIRLQSQEPPIRDLVQLDDQGREQLRVSRLSRDIVGAGTDRSSDPAFVEAMAHRVYFGRVYFREESEPYLTIAVAHGHKSGVTVAEVNLKFIWEVISQIKVGKDGNAYVVDRLGRLVAHPDISLVLRRTDMSGLVQVATALKPQGQPVTAVDGRNLTGASVLSAYAPIPALGWLVFVELPTAEAEQPVVDTGLRALGLLVLGLVISGGAAALLARHMVVPIRAMQRGAERIGSGDLAHRLSIRTGDELEALAEQFNRSAAALAEQVEELGRVGRLKRFLAPQLAEMIVSQGDEKILESHRREIVVVFCDLRGYTAFAETAEPEEVLNFLREYHGALGPLVSQFEGTLDQFSGDGIMVFFNDPVPIPDPAERAVKMAVAMREAASTLIAAWRERGRQLGFGVGIAQGYATLGQIGFSERSGYTAIGTVCNVAARLCGEAKDSQILLGQLVNVALKGSVATEQVGALALKGLTQPVVAYNVPLAASPPALRVIDGGSH
jgi:class 3 adenylate cyclase